MGSRMKIYCLLVVLMCLGHGTAESYDAIVVGLGASGLGALSRLAESGHRVLGLESKGRLGGRVNTQQFGGGLVEFGAEWIHGEDTTLRIDDHTGIIGVDLTHDLNFARHIEDKAKLASKKLGVLNKNAVYEIARQNNISIQDTIFSPHFIRSGGGLNETVVAEVFGYLQELSDEESIPHNLTVGQYLTERFHQYVNYRPAIASDKEFCSNILRLFELTLKIDSWHDVSGKGYGEYHKEPGSLRWSWNRFGYRTLFNILLHKHNNGPGLPVDIRLNTKVNKIDWSDDGAVTVTASSGDTYRAKAVIVTVSLGVLKHSHAGLFEPSLPIEKARAIAALSFGVVDKICLYYEDIWWGEVTLMHFLWTNEFRSKIPAEDWWIQEISSMSVPMSNDHVITLWITGAAARHMETMDAAVVKAKTKGLLELFLKDGNITVPDAKDMRRSAWYSDPDVRGSYSFHGLVSDAVPTAVEELASPLPSAANPRLLFAGEATDPHHFATVHGALQSGWREADRFHGVYGGKSA